MPQPIAYLITWSTYGTWLHGDARGWRDRKDEFYPGKYKPDPLLEERRRKQLRHAPVILTPEMRTVVEEVIREVCDHRGWKLLAVNVRSNHVHVVVGAPCDSDKALGDLKAYATRRLRERELIEPDKTSVDPEGGQAVPRRRRTRPGGCRLHTESAGWRAV